MTESELDILYQLLYRKDGNEMLDEADVKSIFSYDSQAWKVFYHDNPSPKAKMDFCETASTFEDCFRGELKYRAWRILKFRNDPKEDATNPWYTYSSMLESYVGVRKFVAMSPEHSLRQKKTYISLLAAGLLTALRDESVDDDFCNYFKLTKLFHQVWDDRDLVLQDLYNISSGDISSRSNEIPACHMEI